MMDCSLDAYLDIETTGVNRRKPESRPKATMALTAHDNT